MALRDTSIIDLQTLRSFLNQRMSAAVAVSITSSGTFAHVLQPAHGYISGLRVTIAGADQVEYNGTYLITVIDTDHYRYTFAGSLISPATGPITARAEDTSLDDTLSLIGDGVSDTIERETSGHIFKPRDFTESYRGTGKNRVWLRHIPIIAISEVLNEGEVVDPTDYTFDASLGSQTTGVVELLHGLVFARGPNAVQVTYRAGYDPDVNGDIPADATLLCLELAKADFDELKSGALTFASVTAGPSTVHVRPGMNPRHQRMLSKLRDVR